MIFSVCNLRYQRVGGDYPHKYATEDSRLICVRGIKHLDHLLLLVWLQEQFDTI